MKIMILGGGGREHALAWAAARSPHVAKVFVVPGNAGTELEPNTVNVPIAADAIDECVQFARTEAVDLTIVGPEGPLVAGIVDRFAEAGLKCFGPTRSAAVLEGSKSFAKAFLQRHGIATAPYAAFTDVNQARDYIFRQTAPVVVKADGLAAGKGVVIAHTLAEAVAAAEAMLQDQRFGAAGREIIVEGFLQGEEASFMVLTDGEYVVPLASSQDHKARDDGDQGPNTGGMGAYSPAPVITSALQERVLKEIIFPTLRGMAAEGRRYCGFLYAGLMIDACGNPHVLEYNCRLGDPETQVILLRLRSDLVLLCQAALSGTLQTQRAEWDTRVALGVVMAAEGYPERYRQGDVINGLSSAETDTCKVFHAGTARRDADIVTAGGRVLSVCALGGSVHEARRLVYNSSNRIHWSGAFARNDIGYRALAREAEE